MKNNSLLLKLCILCAILMMISCGSDTKEKTKTTPTTSNETEKITETPKANNTFYAWVDNINVRDAASTKGKVIGTYTSEDALEFSGTKSDSKEIIVLRGVAYDDYWLKITTKDNKVGWVYGGAVHQKGDTKGNDIITKDKFDFNHFGKFDVSSWTDLGITRREGGDAETVTNSYLKGNQIIEIEKTDVGEYGYYHTYRLMDAKRKLLKERTFSFNADAGDSKPKMELTETVKDFISKKEYTRTQTLSEHFMQLNARPQMVNGTWEEAELIPTEKAATTEETPLAQKTAFAKPMEVINSLKGLPNEFSDGCNCSFRTHPKDFDTMLVFGTFQDAPKAKAVIQINGKLVMLNSKKPENPNHKLGEIHKHYYNDAYDLKFTLTKDGTDDGGGTQYAGTAHLTSKDGKVNTTINIFGGCGC
ncbi:bacterial SH3 domain protein [Kordia sp. SMS9]|uniref:SH3 domain-containing protein n=1 Tax=Kordia sp. SMS9 TaxID=2282170 RepID=UPI000E0D88E8|nr:SH3 domain-containing protein [Kordia sp. SMS9]AXG69865.1 bacterial SH3 domain protein [Kordia sp. SMS9]